MSQDIFIWISETANRKNKLQRNKLLKSGIKAFYSSRENKMKNVTFRLPVFSSLINRVHTKNFTDWALKSHTNHPTIAKEIKVLEVFGIKTIAYKWHAKCNASRNASSFVIHVIWNILCIIECYSMMFK